MCWPCVISRLAWVTWGFVSMLCREWVSVCVCVYDCCHLRQRTSGIVRSFSTKFKAVVNRTKTVLAHAQRRWLAAMKSSFAIDRSSAPASLCLWVCSGFFFQLLLSSILFFPSFLLICSIVCLLYFVFFSSFFKFCSYNSFLALLLFNICHLFVLFYAPESVAMLQKPIS